MKNTYLLFLLLYSLSAFPQLAPVEINFDLEEMEVCEEGLSSFVESIEYIPLETKEECLIGEGMSFDIDDTHIAVKYNSCESVYLFDRKGRFLRTIGTTGGGPKEYWFVENVFLDPVNDCVVIATPGKVVYFNKQGEFLRSIPFPVDERRTASYFHGQFLRMADSYIFRDSTFHVYAIYNDKGYLLKEAIASIPIPLKKDPRWRLSYKCKEITSVYTYQNMPHVREYLNDTIYMINGLNQFKPKYIINLGKYKVTPEIQADIAHYKDRMQDKVVIVEIMETANSLFFQYVHKWGIHSCRYDKKERKLYKFYTSGYPNDYDGGMDFQVKTLLNGQKNRFVYTCFSVEELISFTEQSKKRNIKGPKSAAQAFKKLTKRIDPDDNPIIMVMKLKE